MTDLLNAYYNKFNEDHRLTTRHGIVEFTTSLKYIHDFLPEVNTEKARQTKILDLGAGTGRYSIALSKEGFDLTAVELTKRNYQVLESKHEKIKLWPGDARDLHFLEDHTFDMTLIFGPLYHLHSEEEKLKVFSEARRVTKKGGIILAAYVMCDYALIEYCFKKAKIKECIDEGSVTSDFHTKAKEDELYDYIQLDQIDSLNKKSGLERIKIIAADGPSDYMRKELNAMNEETFNYFIKYHLATCERKDLLGASSHTVDILRN
jgi:ubiquinone/menaquinone biosynthesis C-methylase UbiE